MSPYHSITCSWSILPVFPNHSITCSGSILPVSPYHSITCSGSILPVSPSHSITCSGSILPVSPYHSSTSVAVYYLCLREHETRGHLEALGSREVLVLPEVLLQFQQLLRRECCAGTPGLPQERVLPWGIGKGEVSVNYLPRRGYSPASVTDTGS